MLKRVFIRTAKIVGALTLGMFLIAGIGFFFPSLVFNSTTLPAVAGITRALSVPVQWSSGKWTAKSVSFWKKEIDFSFRDLCYFSPAPFTRACLVEVEGAFVFDLRHRTLSIQSLLANQANVMAESAIKQNSPETKQGSRPLQAIEDLRKSWLRHLDWKDIQVKSILVLWTSSTEVLRLNGSIEGRAADGNRALSVNLEGSFSQNRKRRPIAANMTAQIPPQGVFSYSIAASWGDASERVRIQTRGEVHPQKLDGTIEASAVRLVKGLQKVSIEQCQYGWKEVNSKDDEARLDCSVLGTLTSGAEGRSGLLPLFRARGLNTLQAGVKLHALLPGSDWTKAKGELTLSSETLQRIGVPTQVSSVFDFGSKDPKAVTLELRSEVPEFAQVAEALEDTAWAVPAPLNQLRGKIAINASAAARASLDKTGVTFNVKTELASNVQRLNLQSDGTVALEDRDGKSHAHLEANVEIGETRLSLPRLDPLRMPRLFPDPNIIYPGTDSVPSAFSYHIAIKTQPKQPIKLYANEYRTDIPVELDLVLASDSGLTGDLNVKRFPIELLRRQAVIRHVKIHFPKEGAAELNARVDIRYADYELTLAAFGALDAPRFSITSNPPLSENSAYSLLLFGRPLEELSPGQGESLASTRAAVSSGAISALSMYLLASTPVESISYDPEARRFLATVRLGEGTSLRIENVQAGVAKVGIRRRLGRDWVLNTYVERASPLDDRRSVSTYLEWSKTY